jgi:hypothetical protein
MNRFNPFRRRFVCIAVWVIVCLSLCARPETGGGTALPPPAKHRYVIMLAISNDSSLEKTMDQDFLAALQQSNKTRSLRLSRSGKPWEDSETCKTDPHCDRITINADDRKLLIWCNAGPPDKRKGPTCLASPNLFREKCIDTLPTDFIDEVWNHSKAFHPGEL